jgi:hypothetical protein
LDEKLHLDIRKPGKRIAAVLDGTAPRVEKPEECQRGALKFWTAQIKSGFIEGDSVLSEGSR